MTARLREFRLPETPTGFPLPFGAAKWITLPSLLNMLTSSMAWIGWTLSFFSVCCSFLSSPPDRAGARLTFLRGVPLPLHRRLSSAVGSKYCSCAGGVTAAGRIAGHVHDAQHPSLALREGPSLSRSLVCS